MVNSGGLEIYVKLQDETNLVKNNCLLDTEVSSLMNNEYE